MLSNLGCNEIQGYFLSRPQPLEQLAEAAFTAKNKLLESKKEIVESRTGRGQANYSGKTTLINEMNLLEKELPTNENFDRITRTVKAFFQMPMCYITFIRGNKQSIKSSYGLPPEVLDIGEFDLDKTICQAVVATQEGQIILDLRKDKRFAENEFVKEFGLRFYASAPLKSKDGEIIGTLCLMDVYPRAFSKEQYAHLADFSYWVMGEMEKNIYSVQ